MFENAEPATRSQYAADLISKGLAVIGRHMVIDANGGNQVEARIREWKPVRRFLQPEICPARRIHHFRRRIAAASERKSRPSHFQQLTFSAPDVEPRLAGRIHIVLRKEIKEYFEFSLVEEDLILCEPRANRILQQILIILCVVVKFAAQWLLTLRYFFTRFILPKQNGEGAPSFGFFPIGVIDLDDVLAGNDFKGRVHRLKSRSGQNLLCTDLGSV